MGFSYHAQRFTGSNYLDVDNPLVEHIWSQIKPLSRTYLVTNQNPYQQNISWDIEEECGNEKESNTGVVFNEDMLDEFLK